MYKAPVAFTEYGNLSAYIESERCLSLKNNPNDRKYNADSVKNFFQFLIYIQSYEGLFLEARSLKKEKNRNPTGNVFVLNCIQRTGE